MKFEHLEVPDNQVLVDRRVSNGEEYCIYTVTCSDEYDAEYIYGLKSLSENTGNPIYIDGNYYEIVSAKRHGNTVKLVAKKLVGRYLVVSENTLIPNSFVDDTTKQPTIVLPKGTKVLYSGIVPETEGLVDVYEAEQVELVEPIPLSIKIYDDMGTTDES